MALSRTAGYVFALSIHCLALAEQPQDEPRVNPLSICESRINTANAWLAVSDIKADIRNPAQLCKEMASWLGSSPGKGIPPWLAQCRGDALLAKVQSADFVAPSRLERLARVPQFKAEFLRTPNYVYAIQEGSPRSTDPQIYPNPDHGLLNLGGTLDFGEYFLDAGKRMTICEARSSLSTEVTKSCGDSLYLNARTKADWLRRYASATAINVNVTQIPQYQGGIIVSATSPAYGLRWSYTVTGSISPAALFETAGQRKQYGEYYTAHHESSKSLHPVGAIDMKDKCMDKDGGPQPLTSSCLKALASSTPLNRSLLAFLPKVDVKAYTAFDFTKTGSNTFLALPEGNKPLYDVTLTWDLRSTIPSSQMRADAVSAFQSMASVEKQEDARHRLDSAKDRLGRTFLELSIDTESVLTGKASTSQTCADNTWWSDFRDNFDTFIAIRQTMR